MMLEVRNCLVVEVYLPFQLTLTGQPYTQQSKSADLFSLALLALQLGLQALHFCFSLLTICMLALASLQLLCMQVLQVIRSDD